MKEDIDTRAMRAEMKKMKRDLELAREESSKAQEEVARMQKSMDKKVFEKDKVCCGWCMPCANVCTHYVPTMHTRCT